QSELERQRKLADAVPKTAGQEADLNERVEAYEKIGHDADLKARELSRLTSNLDIHELRPGEEALRKSLRDSSEALGASAATLAAAIHRHPLENLDSYDSAAFTALKRWAADFKQTSQRT